jgi:hypothetical protein
LLALTGSGRKAGAGVCGDFLPIIGGFNLAIKVAKMAQILKYIQ